MPSHLHRKCSSKHIALHESMTGEAMNKNRMAAIAAAAALACGTLMIPAGAANAAKAGPAVVHPDASYALGVDFWDANYGGSTQTATTTSSSLCASGLTFQWSSMPSGWNDKVSSLWVYGTCHTTLYENSGFKGATDSFSADTKSLGVFNDETSSQTWHR
jgi:hypothetical protein